MSPLDRIEFQHKEHREWMSKLNFYQDEVKVYQNELMVIVHRHPGNMSIIEHVEEYRKIFMHKLEMIDEFRKQIMLNENKISSQQETEFEDVWDHEDLRTRIKMFSREFEQLKNTFRMFASHND